MWGIRIKRRGEKRRGEEAGGDRRRGTWLCGSHTAHLC